MYIYTIVKWNNRFLNWAIRTWWMTNLYAINIVYLFPLSLILFASIVAIRNYRKCRSHVCTSFHWISTIMCKHPLANRLNNANASLCPKIMSHAKWKISFHSLYAETQSAHRTHKVSIYTLNTNKHTYSKSISTKSTSLEPLKLTHGGHTSSL